MERALAVSLEERLARLQKQRQAMSQADIFLLLFERYRVFLPEPCARHLAESAAEALSHSRDAFLLLSIKLKKGKRLPDETLLALVEAPDLNSFLCAGSEEEVLQFIREINYAIEKIRKI